MLIKNKEEIKLIKKSSILTSKTLGIMSEYIKPGVNLLKLDKIAYEYINDNGGKPAFLGLYNYPNTICTSINNEVVHGIPRNINLKEGDIISIDCGVLMNKYYGEHAYTFGVGEISKIKKKLLKYTKKSLYIGIKESKIGKRIGDIGYKINKFITNKGFKVVKDLFGHGIGRKIHEYPNIPNYGKKNTGIKIKNGMVLSIEPIVNQGTSKIKLSKDKWTYLTKDNLLSAHYEHNIAIIDNKTKILSTFKYINNI
ncbi:type I methionyl aminopeptidase [Candidatus Shikimatogenerans bostrichidophilus]|uniref:type I methionyl aminopeptidase n=1 Tax=Candidatus Shikimatogenerans bostrichidophilus TaxID=2943807 RepID=UPI00296626FA